MEESFVYVWSNVAHGYVVSCVRSTYTHKHYTHRYDDSYESTDQCENNQSIDTSCQESTREISSGESKEIERGTMNAEEEGSSEIGE